MCSFRAHAGGRDGLNLGWSVRFDELRTRFTGILRSVRAHAREMDRISSRRSVRRSAPLAEVARLDCPCEMRCYPSEPPDFLTRSARVHVRETVECVPVEYVPPLAYVSARIPNFYTGPRARAKDGQD